MSASLNIPFPNVPFIDMETGNVTRAWWYFLQGLQIRTGGTSGTSSGIAIQASIYGLMGDTSEGAPGAPPIPFDPTPSVILGQAMDDVDSGAWKARQFFSALVGHVMDDPLPPQLSARDSALLAMAVESTI